MEGATEWGSTDAGGMDMVLTLSSGQFFRYARAGDAFRVVVRDDVFLLRQEGDRVRFRGADEAIVARFLGSDKDAEGARRRLGRHEGLRGALAATRGLRILRQDPWECLAAFHCSAASNIPRIRRQVEGLARAFGRPIGRGDLRDRSFPRPGAIRSGPELRAVRLGFRERRLLDLQERVDEAWLARLAALPHEEQRAWLMSLPGVGPKVADCVLLFSLGRSGAFPIDVWIGRAVRRLAPRGARTYQRLRAWAAATFGDDAGLAQQALFVWARQGGLQTREPRRESRMRSAARPSP